MRPEPSLDAERCQRGGGDDLPPFPGERASEALQTVRWLDELRDELALFIVGRFELVAGARVAREPARFGLAETWHVAGDRYRSALFYREEGPGWSEGEELRVERAVDQLATHFRLSHYPWGGALSTAHSLLYYLRLGPGAFRRDPEARERTPRVPGARRRVFPAHFDVERVSLRSEERELAIWGELTHGQRQVSPEAYAALADRIPAARPSPGRWEVEAGQPPRRVR